MRVLDWAEMELLLALLHLRYLSTAQIHARWYRERTLAAAAKRLSRLASNGVVTRVALPYSTWKAAWRLGRQGLLQLRSVKGQDFPNYRNVTPQYLPHLLATNEVWSHLAGAHRVWARLPFSWVGSHGAALRFESLEGIGRRRSRIIRPDAIVTRKSSNGIRRLFVELDRSTERIRARDGQRSITRKLEAYKEYLQRGPLAERRTWYRAQFEDRATTRILFVLEKNDTRARNPKLRHRRARSILAVADKVFASRAPVRVSALDAPEDIRARLGMPAEPSAPEPPRPKLAPTALLEHEAFVVLRDYYVESVQLIKHSGLSQKERKNITGPAKKARSVLEHLGKGFGS